VRKPIQVHSANWVAGSCEAAVMLITAAAVSAPTGVSGSVLELVQVLALGALLGVVLTRSFKACGWDCDGSSDKW
jgi:hypothetical protein